LYGEGQIEDNFSSAFLTGLMESDEEIELCKKELDLRKDLKPKGIEGFVPKQLLEFSELFYKVEELHKGLTSNDAYLQYKSSSYTSRLESEIPHREGRKVRLYQWGPMTIPIFENFTSLDDQLECCLPE